MAAWFNPLLVFLAEQPPTVAALTLTLAELQVLAGEPLPAGATTWTYWQGGAADAPSQQLAAVGWRVRRFSQQPLTMTFARRPDSRP